MELQKINQDNRERINQFIIHQWFTMQMVVHGESINLGEADGWYACDNNEIIGLVTYHIAGNEMEILSLDSLIENKGTGTALLHQALLDAKNAGLTRVRLITTNDNLHALRYYQKRGFDIIGFNYNALDEARKIKPEIPLTGMDGIPLKHEIELELLL
jgi:ribosomal protein S18 acetylase RimI-like enzyme|uniref:Acetyltransferase domain containing protein n=1 Tax=Siphoviridae sp. ctSA812 TaxID=2825508 RepID=A0A8S5U3H1_9CAUD|nr:MAG TPA: acetyltransferase domain containing protein [Siphoviridae sp. ctSA812]